MSLYQCEKCGCAENTACGWYHYPVSKNWKYKTSEPLLCSACAPTKLDDDSPTGFAGKWHGFFERHFYPLGILITNEKGNLQHKDTGGTGKDLHKYRLESKESESL